MPTTLHAVPVLPLPGFHPRHLPLLGVLALSSLVQAGAADAPAAPPAPAADAGQGGAPGVATDDRSRLEALERRLAQLEAAQHAHAVQVPAAAAGAGLQFGAYGEIKYGAIENPADGGAWQAGFDAGRLTLLPSYQFSDALVLRAEIEFEHGGIAFDDDDKLGGTVEIEQAYVDWTINEHLHWRLPGVDVVPFGYTNLYHEPTLFYSVDRNELANGLIPTTWFEGSTSIHGSLAGPVSYQFQISTSLVDDGSNVEAIPASGTPAPGYPPGIDGLHALTLSRSSTSENALESNEAGYALRLASTVPGVAGLAGSISGYLSPNIEPRAVIGQPKPGRCSLAMEDIEARYRPLVQGLELRAELVEIQFSRPGNLRANNDGDATDNVGRGMWGASGEIAWHWRPNSVFIDVVPFYRYTYEDFQEAGVEGTDPDAPTGAGRLQYHTFGVALFPIPELVIKADASIARNGSAGGPKDSRVLGGVGFFF